MNEQADIHELLMKMMCCTMCADMRIDNREIRAICSILKELNVPWSREDVERRLKDFTQAVRSKGILRIIEESLNQIKESHTAGKSKLLLGCIDRVIHSDNFVDYREVELLQKFKSALNSIQDESQDFDIESEVSSWAKIDFIATNKSVSEGSLDKSMPDYRRMPVDKIERIRRNYQDECGVCRRKADRGAGAIMDDILSNIRSSAGGSTEDIAANAFSGAFSKFDRDMKRADERAFENIMKEFSLTREALNWVLSDQASQLIRDAKANESKKTVGSDQSPAREVKLSVSKNPDGTETYIPSEISREIPTSCPYCYNTLQDVVSKGHDAQWAMAMEFLERGVFFEHSRLILQCSYCSKEMVIFKRDEGTSKLTLTLT